MGWERVVSHLETFFRLTGTPTYLCLLARAQIRKHLSDTFTLGVSYRSQPVPGETYRMKIEQNWTLSCKNIILAFVHKASSDSTRNLPPATAPGALPTMYPMTPPAAPPTYDQNGRTFATSGASLCNNARGQWLCL
jgi:hypothetical protein